MAGKSSLHDPNQGREVVNFHAVDRDDTIASLESGALRWPVVFDAADVGRQVPGTKRLESQPVEQHAWLGEPPCIVADIDRHGPLPTVSSLQRQRYAAVGNHVIEHCYQCSFPVGRGNVTDGNDPVPLL